MADRPQLGFEPAEIIPGSAQAAFANLIVVLADSKYFMGKRMSEWVFKAPRLEVGVACAATTAEELGMARILYPLLEQIPNRKGPLPLERERDRPRRYCISFLDQPYPTWSHVVAALALMDSAMNVIFEALTSSTYTPIKKRAIRILDEERFHTDLAESMVREMATFRAGLIALQKRVGELMPEMLAWFGPDGEPGTAIMREEGMISQGNKELRQSWLHKVVPLLEENHLAAPGILWDVDENRWRYPEPPWDRWTPLERRLTVASGEA